MFFSFSFHTDNIVTKMKKFKNRGKKITDTPSAPRYARTDALSQFHLLIDSYLLFATNLLQILVQLCVTIGDTLRNL